MNNPCFSIAAVERDTGLSKDVLRMWERRYGFPLPDRDSNGERSYPAEQVERLRLIKRLIDAGHRPGKLIAAPAEELAGLVSRRSQARPEITTAHGSELGELLALIKSHDSYGFLHAMQQRLARQGLHNFVQDTVAPLTHQVGLAWEDGSIEVFEEHLFTELSKRLLRQAIAGLPGGQRSPRILLTSVPDEPHALGLLMAEALFALEGAECIPLGTQMPLLEISRAASAHQANIVALSFSSAFAQRQIPGLLQQLRMVLPPAIALWAGGAGVQRLAQMEGIQLFTSLDNAVSALANWNQTRTPA
ncbi:MAG: MerR family transcriptional regulator [Azonexus sp.]|nr:MerR family transcriptional regulator [Azonexus sp.]MDZ4315868.1 MerR family transcriptional regulator [Azonexus sp.]